MVNIEDCDLEKDINITHGYAKNKRFDLKQVVLSLTNSCQLTVTPDFIYVADSALYTKDKLLAAPNLIIPLSWHNNYQ